MDTVGGWFAKHWFDLLQSVGIVAGLVFTAVSLRRESRTRRESNLVNLTKLHRQLWLEMCRRPDFSRLLSREPDLQGGPITASEELFINLFIVHLSTVWELVRDGKVVSQEAVVRDVQTFFALPLPRTVWDRTKAVRDQGFVRFIDACLPAQTGPPPGEGSEAV